MNRPVVSQIYKQPLKLLLLSTKITFLKQTTYAASGRGINCSHSQCEILNRPKGRGIHPKRLKHRSKGILSLGNQFGNESLKKELRVIEKRI